MTVGELFNILKQNDIPDDAVLMSDSGWECCATDTDGVYYNKSKNTVVLTQKFSEYAYYHESNDWIECRNAHRMAIKALEQEPCEDAVSRKDIYFKLTNGAYPNETIEQFIDRLVKELEDSPSVTPTHKKGKWIVEDSGNYNGKWSTCYCSYCKDYYTRDWREMNYCPNCGAKMESEGA